MAHDIRDPDCSNHDETDGAVSRAGIQGQFPNRLSHNHSKRIGHGGAKTGCRGNQGHGNRCQGVKTQNQTYGDQYWNNNHGKLQQADETAHYGGGSHNDRDH